jgi:hypothetical protein
MAVLGTSESLMRHPANDRSWPKALVLVIFLNDSNVPEAEVSLSILNGS